MYAVRFAEDVKKETKVWEKCSGSVCKDLQSTNLLDLFPKCFPNLMAFPGPIPSLPIKSAQSLKESLGGNPGSVSAGTPA
jgi:hypothetical protein